MTTPYYEGDRQAVSDALSNPGQYNNLSYDNQAAYRNAGGWVPSSPTDHDAANHGLNTASSYTGGGGSHGSLGTLGLLAVIGVVAVAFYSWTNSHPTASYVSTSSSSASAPTLSTPTKVYAIDLNGNRREMDEILRASGRIPNNEDGSGVAPSVVPRIDKSVGNYYQVKGSADIQSQPNNPAGNKLLSRLPADICVQVGKVNVQTDWEWAQIEILYGTSPITAFIHTGSLRTATPGACVPVSVQQALDKAEHEKTARVEAERSTASQLMPQYQKDIGVYYKIGTDFGNVRLLPNLTSENPPLGRLLLGTCIQLGSIDRQSGWARTTVTKDGNVVAGFIHTHNLRPATPSECP